MYCDVMIMSQTLHMFYTVVLFNCRASNPLDCNYGVVVSKWAACIMECTTHSILFHSMCGALHWYAWVFSGMHGVIVAMSAVLLTCATVQCAFGDRAADHAGGQVHTQALCSRVATLRHC